MATKPKTQIMSHDDTVMSPITKASNVLFEDGKTAQDKLEDNVEKSFTPSVENSSSMFKVGQGDGVDYSDNVLDGAYVSCVLKGKTMVNCIQESSSQDVILPYEFTEGQYVTINETKESGALGVELKGRTLVNEALVDYMTFGSGASINDGRVTLDLSKQYSRVEISRQNPLIAPNQTYTCVLYDVVGDVTNVSFTVQNASSTKMHLKNVGYKFKFIMGVGNDSTNRYCYVENLVATSGTLSFKMVLLKGDYTNVDAPYFTGVASVKAPTVRTVGKNLFNHTDNEKICRYIGGSAQDNYTLYYTVQQSTITVTGQPLHTYVLGYKLPLQHDKSITISASSGLGDLLYYRYYGKNFTTLPNVWQEVKFYAGDDEKKYVTFKSTEYPVDAEYVLLGIGNAGKSDYVINNLQIEYGETVTTYEPYKSSSLTLPSEEVILRSLPNGVCDTFNTRTGDYVRRIGEKTLNGSESWGVWQQGGDHLTQKTVVGFGLNLEDAPTTKSFYVLCDRFATGGTTSGADNDHSYYVYHKELIYGYYANASTYRRLGLSVSKTKLGIPNDNTDATQALVSLRAYLASNPIKVQYELATPIITKLPLQSTLKPWNTTTHIYTEIPQNSLYPILSHSNPTYPVILKPSTKYSIVANSYSNNHTNSPVNFNLGGATASTTVGNRVTTVTTPSALGNNLLTMSGRGNKLNHVMVIEGDVVGDEPYFEGICDVKSPVVKNVGKNLFDLNGEWVKCVYSYGVPQVLLSHSGTIAISNNGFSITTQANDYNRGFGQYINVSSLDTLYVKATAIYTDTKTVPELKVIGLYENESIPVSVNSTNSSDFKVITKQLGSEQEVSFDLDVSSYSKIFIMFSGGWKSGMSGSYTFTMKDVYIGSSNQTYEPYKSNTTTFDQKDGKIIVLRSLPNGICDTLNVETGEYVQRIGGKVFDGKGNGWQVLPYPPHDNDTHYQFKYWFGENLIGGDLWNNAQSILANTLPSASGALHWSSQGKYGIGGDRSHFMITWEKSSSPFHDVATLNAWLQANPITVQYELATPIISTIDVQGFPYAYKDGHVQLSSGYNGQSLTPKIEYSLPINRNGQIRMNQVMVERHQKHIDKLQAMIITNMVNTQYRQSLTKINYQLGGE